MAFTVNQVQPVLENLVPSWARPGFESTLELIKEYLTGQTSSLSGLQANYENVYLHQLAALLKLPHQWNENDQLVLDVLTHAAVWRDVQQNVIIFVTTQIENAGIQEALDAFIVFLKKHLTPELLFHWVLKANSAAGHWDDEKQRTSLKAGFLKQFLQTVDQTTLSKILADNMHARFNASLLRLLQETRPNETEGYMLTNLVHRQQIYLPVLEVALNTDSEKYLPFIRFQLELQASNKEREAIENRFEALQTINATYPGTINDLLQQAASDYLECFAALKNIGYEKTFGANKVQRRFSDRAARIVMETDAAGGKDKLWKVIQKTKYLPASTLSFLVEKLGKDALPFLVKSLQAEVYIDGVEHHANVIKLLEQFDKSLFNDQVWALLSHKSKQLRDYMIVTLSEKEDALEKSTALLNHKSADARLSAAVILSILGTPEAKAALQAAVASEKNDDARDVMLYTVAGSLYKVTSIPIVNQLAEDARNRGKLSEPLEPWLQEEAMPAIYYKNGQELSHDVIRFLLYRMARIKAMRSDLEARMVMLLVDKEKSAAFALNLIKLFIDNGTKAEHKYLLALSALLGDEAVADKIRITIDKWIDDSRFKMAEYGVGALALQGSDKALRWVEFYSRKYRTRKANVGAAALVALEAAAEELGITTYELGDRIVPDFGFEGLFKTFEVDGETYRAFIDSNFKIAFFNDDNKKLKSIPAAASAELKEEFKAIAKEVRDVVKSQSSRLEYYMVIQRRWTVEQWQQFFLNNPVMFIYATKLIWGVYDNNQLTQCFYCQEDTTLVDADDNEITLPDNAQIGIVHPLQLSPEALQAWNKKFFDLAIEPEFAQLNRPVYILPEEDKQQTIIQKYDGVKTASGAIKSTLEKHGWQKGPAEDAGSINVFFKNDHEGGIKTVLEVEGVFAAGFDSDITPKLGRLYFIKPDKEKSHWFNPAKDNNDPRLIPLGEIPAVFYSEVIAGISAIKLLPSVQTAKKE